jgi:manganese/zinc/iron transport system substrate-binding protein
MQAENPELLRILCTTSHIQNLVDAIGGDTVLSLVLIPPDLDPHSYELVKGDGEKFSRAAWVFANGLNLEHGASLHTLLTEQTNVTQIGHAIQTQAPERILWSDGFIDPHIWMDVSLWALAIDPIVDQLSKLSPEHRDFYHERGQNLTTTLRQFDQELWQDLQQISEPNRYLVTSHDAFRYFVRRYLALSNETPEGWEKRLTAPEGLAPEGQLSPLDLQRTMLFLQEHRIQVIFPESNVSPVSLDKICKTARQMGQPLRVCTTPLYGDSTGGLSYIEAMRHNKDVLVANLGRQ